MCSLMLIQYAKVIQVMNLFYKTKLHFHPPGNILSLLLKSLAATWIYYYVNIATDYETPGIYTDGSL